MAGSSYDVIDCKFSNISAVNVNSKDTTSRSWIDIQSGSGKLRQRLSFSNITMTGLSSSTRTGDVGVNVRHDIQDVFFSDILVKNVAGIGLGVGDAIADTKSNIHYTNVTVDGSNAQGCKIVCDDAAATIKETYFNNCVTKDCCKRTGSTGFWLLANFAASTINHIYFRNCRSFKTSGTTHLYGIQLEQVAGAIDNIWVEGCDLSGTQTDWFLSSGTVTNVKFRPPSDRGTDIVAAATIAIPADGDCFHVTGNTNVTNGITVNPWDNGRLVVLIFEGTPTVSDTGTSKLAGNFPAAGTTNDFDTLTLKCDGTNWTEVTRSTN
jgi:hypothetical protein